MTAEALARRLRGSVLRAGDPGLAAETLAYNTAFTLAPDLAVRATCPDDVAAAFGHARERGLGVAVQATGHGLTADVAGALLVSTRGMRAVTVDPGARTARIEAGATWGEVIKATTPYGLAPLNGSFPGVGAIGFTLGGGLGPMSRKYGYAADHVRSFEVVTPDGVTRTVDPEREPDLFWGLRGGKGNLAIVTSMVIGLVPVARFYAGGVYFAGESAEDLLHAYRDWVTGLPDETTSSIAILRLPDAPGLPEQIRGRVVVHLRMAHLGSAEEGAALVAPLRRMGTVLLDELRERPYTEVGAIHNDPPNPLDFGEYCVLLRDLPVGDLLAAAGPDVELPLDLVEIRHLGGAAAREPQIPNAVGGRDAEFCLLSVGLPEYTATAGAAVANAVAASHTGGTLLNFCGQGDPRRAYTAETYGRLAALKRVYDPQGLLRFGHVVEV
ncbi:FAD/FMN-containing dehydrogenase [Sinosporangium album]|uniref:FAD/FMN-containing dehydrogenase n=1 Tax=Sinosporangium album TaxID=504805 RepID=A0A1G8E3Z6_9ACTN|nr:FAD-binding oxidoreductase [Sinosporangium album]SDH64440.1 FAD/FMN-containing dehydrogenase [Sinosporangium album]